jgi:hypothetical protein
MSGNPIARMVGTDRNPLRRATDRIEARLTLALVLVLVILGPLAVWRAAAAAYHSAVAAAERDQRQQRFQVTALLQDDPAKYVVSSGDGPALQGAVPARWTAPDGTARSGPVVPPLDARSGATVVIVTDVHGNLSQPLPTPDPVWTALSAGAAMAIGLVGVVVGVLVVLRRILDRRRMSDWQTEWRLVERRWSGRL